MKAKDLLEILKQVDPESNVAFWMDDGCCGDIRELEAYDAEAYTESKDSFASIRFSAVPGYYSCRQSGQTVSAHTAYWKKVKGDES